jgi:hypothetical protein
VLARAHVPIPPPNPSYCDRCDLLVGLDGFHVIAVTEQPGKRGRFLRVVVESPARVETCHECGVVAESRGRRAVRPVDTPCLGRPLVWRHGIVP